MLPALNTGRINACYGSPLAAVALQWYTKAKYATSMPMAYGVAGTLVRKQTWDKLSAEDQKATEKTFRIQAQKLKKAVRSDNERAAKAISRAGVKTIDTPPAMAAEFEKHAQSVWQEMVGKVYSKDDLDTVLKYRAEFRAGAK